MKLIAFLLPALAAAAPSMQTLGRIPLYFEPNQGQTADEVRFLARGGGMTMFLTGRETVLASRGGSAVRMRLEGSRKTAELEPLEKQPGVSNYYRGNDPTKWRTGVPHYAKVKARSVYDGIDVVYYGDPQRLEYDFIVAPGADPSVIRLAYDGADKVRIDDRGDLVLTTSTGELRQHKPRVYQEFVGRRIEIEASYRLHGHEATFALARHDRSRPLVIDPILAYGSFLGGSGADRAVGIGLDSSGAIYVGGTTWSPNFPMQAGIDSLAERSEAFVTKLTANGQSLVYSTYIGGSGDDTARAFALQPSGNAFLAGTTQSKNFPTVGGYQSSPASSTDIYGDAFVIKLSASGSLVYGSYLGGSDVDSANAIAVDAAGNAYLAGVTASPDFPGVSAGAPGTGFVCKFGPAGNALLFTVRIGGAGFTMANAITADASGIYLAGYTDSLDFPVFPVSGAFQVSRSGSSDAFVAKVKPDGSGLLYSTYLGGSGSSDVARAIAVDAGGSAYVTGSTDSGDFPVRNAVYPSPGSGFMVKLNREGTSMLFGTYLGGVGQAVAVDAAQRATVGGATEDRGFTIVSGWQSQFPGDDLFRSGFLVRFNSSGSAVDYSTYVGGDGQSAVNGVFLDSAGATWLTGEVADCCRAALTFPRLNGYSITHHGNLDAYVVKFVDGPAPVSVTIDSSLAGRTVIVDGRSVATPATFSWQPGTPHTLDANSPQTDGVVTYQFSSWSQGGPAAQTIYVSSSSQTYTVTYVSSQCTYTATPASREIGFEGSDRLFASVNAPPGCPWTANSVASWLFVDPATPPQTGSGQFSYRAGPNTGPPRSATITFGGGSFTVTQRGGSATLQAPAITAPVSAQTIRTRSVTFSWSAVTGAAGYDIRVSGGRISEWAGTYILSTALVFQGSQMGAGATSTTIDLRYHSYRFFVRACSGPPSDATCGPFGTVDFNVVLAAPSQAPVIVSPLNGQAFSSSTQEFRWQPLPGVDSYQVTLTDSSAHAEMQINTPGASTIYSMKGSPTYMLSVSGCQAICGPSTQVIFSANLPPVPTSAPAVTTATPLAGNAYRIDWNVISGADIYRVAVVQPNSGPGGGALTVASTQTAVPTVTLTVPPGPASVIVAGCTGRGCGPYSAPSTRAEPLPPHPSSASPSPSPTSTDPSCSSPGAASPATTAPTPTTASTRPTCRAAPPRSTSSPRTISTPRCSPPKAGVTTP